MNEELLDLVLTRDELADLDPAARRLALRSLVLERWSDEDCAALVAEASSFIDGYGPLSDAMQDAEVTDILVNGPEGVWVERRGRLQRYEPSFENARSLRSFIDRIVSLGGARVDASRPVADARLPDGSRVNVVLPPVAPAGPLVSIRKFPVEPMELAELVERGTLSENDAAVLEAAVTGRRTIAIGGPTGTGKTTLLNALLGLVPADERVVTIEETPELRPRCVHAVALTARAENVEGGGEVDLAALLRTALRMRPDRIVVGEVRGPEAAVALDAMSTGHEGSLVTVHARSANEVVDRMVALAAGGSRLSVAALTQRFSSAFDIVVQLERCGPRRRVVKILEIA